MLLGAQPFTRRGVLAELEESAQLVAELGKAAVLRLREQLRSARSRARASSRRDLTDSHETDSTFLHRNRTRPRAASLREWTGKAAGANYILIRYIKPRACRAQKRPSLSPGANAYDNPHHRDRACRGTFLYAIPLDPACPWHHLHGFGGQPAIRMDPFRFADRAPVRLDQGRNPGRLHHLHPL